MAGEEDRRVEEDELRYELRRARRELEGEPTAERVPDERPTRLRADRLDDRVADARRCPTAAPTARSRARGDRVRARGSRRGASASGAKCRPWFRTPCRQTTRGAPGSPHSWSASLTPSARSTSSDSGNQLRPPLVVLFTSDQMTVPSWSMRNVPRCGAPVSSSNTPYAFAAAPCGQKSDANVYSAPSSRFHACRAADGSHETKTISVPASRNDCEVLLEVARLVLADGRERERMEDEQDVRAAAEVGEPHALRVRHLEVELRGPVTCRHRHPRCSSPVPDGR